MSNTQQIVSTEQAVVRGALDLGVMKTGLFSAIVSASQATALAAGDRVKLDTAAGSKLPSVIAAAKSDVAVGVVTHNTKKDSPVSGDLIQVAYFGGPVIWQIAGGTIAAQALVECQDDGTYITQSTQKICGYALDPATSGNLFRMVLTNHDNI